jgi:hypothetical protein
MRKPIIVPVLVCLLAVLAAGEAPAFSDYVSTWRAYYPAACTTLYQRAQNCTLCHNAGFSFNAYGDDLASNNVNFATVGLLDSDGDGRINNDEINHDCTVPADAASPAEEATWSSVKALFE